MDTVTPVDHKDKGLHPIETMDNQLVSDVESPFPVTVDDRALLRKLDWKLLPPLIVLYLLSFLDRSNVANARIEGLAADLKMTGNEYLTGLTLYFVGYTILEVPFNIILKIWTPKLWFPILTFTWGLISLLQGVVQNKSGFYAVRFFLGIAETGFFPGVCWFISQWYRRRERQFRISLFFSAASLAGAFGGILAWAIAHMRGIRGLGGWRWIFILEGILTCVVAILAYFFLVDYPATAKFLTPEEREQTLARLRADCDSAANEGFSWHNVMLALKDYKVWLYGVAFHTMALPLYTLSLFMPTIINAMGYTAASAQLMTIPPYALATVLTIFWAWLSEKYRMRAPFAMMTSLLGIIGYAILIGNKDLDHSRNAGVSYLGVFFAACGVYPSVALSLVWPSNNVGGQTKRAVAAALQISIGNLGAIIGTQIYRTEYAPRFAPAHAVALAYLVANILVSGLLWYCLSRENTIREEKLAAAMAAGKEHEIRGELRGDDDLRWRFSW